MAPQAPCQVAGPGRLWRIPILASVGPPCRRRTRWAALGRSRPIVPPWPAPSNCPPLCGTSLRHYRSGPPVPSRRCHQPALPGQGNPTAKPQSRQALPLTQAGPHSPPRVPGSAGRFWRACGNCPPSAQPWGAGQPHQPPQAACPCRASLGRVPGAGGERGLLPPPPACGVAVPRPPASLESPPSARPSAPPPAWAPSSCPQIPPN